MTPLSGAVTQQFLHLRNQDVASVDADALLCLKFMQHAREIFGVSDRREAMVALLAGSDTVKVFGPQAASISTSRSK